MSKGGIQLSKLGNGGHIRNRVEQSFCRRWYIYVHFYLPIYNLLILRCLPVY